MKEEAPDNIGDEAAFASRRDVIAPLTFNPDDYREHLGENDLSIEQQNAVLEALWQIMSTMVNIGWGVDTVQMFLPDLFENTGQDSGNLLKQNYPETFNQSAANDAGKGDSE